MTALVPPLNRSVESEASFRAQFVALFEPDRVQADTMPFTVPSRPGWIAHRAAPWIHMAPQDDQIPSQGWKIHVSATEATAHQTLSIVCAIAYDLGVAFKFVADIGGFRATNFKYADRAAAGKFITLYPGETVLERLLDRLDARLCGFPGPYILSDVRFGRSPVHLRYGAFREFRAINDDGVETLCLRDEHGRLVPDERGPMFRVPDFVRVPHFLQACVDERLRPTDGGSDSLLAGYAIDRALHFSSGGGVYLLTRHADGANVVMKEGRRHAGLDHRGVDAFDRIHHEYANLRALEVTGLVPRAIELRVVDEHAFLFEEFASGNDLHSWVAKHFPFSYEFDPHVYTERALLVATRLIEAVERIHELGLAVMDLQPTNVIVTHDDEVRLIDLESYCALSTPDASSFLGTPGYVPTGPHSPRDRDVHALRAVITEMFSPLTALSSLSDAVTRSQLRLIERFFPPEVAELLATLDEWGATKRSVDLVVPRTGVSAPPEVRQKILRGLRFMRTEGARKSGGGPPYPLAGRGLRGVPEVSLAHGLGGVLLALGADDPNAAEDLEILGQAVDRLSHAPSGLLDGVLGTALVLAERGDLDRAHQLWRRQRMNSISAQNISLRTGLSGRVIGLLRLSTLLQDTDVREDAVGMIDVLRSRIREARPLLVSPGSLAARPVGLFDGWSGAALALTAAATHLRDTALYADARDSIDLDLLHTCEAPDGSLQAEDGSRMLPYLADGSAGIGVALSMIPRKHRRPQDAQVLQRIARACRARACASSGLYHGRIGLVLALSRLDVDHVSGMPVDQVVAEQLELISPFLFSAHDRTEVFVAGEDNRRFSADFVSGAAGTAYALQLLSGGCSIFGLPEPAEHPSGLDADRESEFADLPDRLRSTEGR